MFNPERILIEPATSNFALGVMVPIPTLEADTAITGVASEPPRTKISLLFIKPTICFGALIVSNDI